MVQQSLCQLGRFLQSRRYQTDFAWSEFTKKPSTIKVHSLVVSVQTANDSDWFEKQTAPIGPVSEWFRLVQRANGPMEVISLAREIGRDWPDHRSFEHLKDTAHGCIGSANLLADISGMILISSAIRCYFGNFGNSIFHLVTRSGD